MKRSGPTGSLERNRRGAAAEKEGVEQKDQKIGKYEEDGSEQVIGALIEVHRALGPGVLESAYEACFCHELRLRGLTFERQRPVGITYKGLTIDCGYRVDVLVEGRIVVELKAIERLLALHAAQILTDMKLLAVRIGLLVNFNVTSLRQGLRRLSLPPPPPF
jgi:GxxExxY protein